MCFQDSTLPDCGSVVHTHLLYIHHCQSGVWPEFRYSQYQSTLPQFPLPSSLFQIPTSYTWQVSAPIFPWKCVYAVKFWTPNRHWTDTVECRANLCIWLYITYWYTLPWLTSVNHATWSNGWVCWRDKILSASKLIRILQATKKQITVYLYGWFLSLFMVVWRNPFPHIGHQHLTP